MKIDNKQNGTFGHSEGRAINYGIQSPDKQMKMKTCKGTGKKLPLTEFYFDKTNNRYESNSKAYKSKMMNEQRKKDEYTQLRQRFYNQKHINKQLRGRIKELEDDKSRG